MRRYLCVVFLAAAVLSQNAAGQGSGPAAGKASHPGGTAKPPKSAHPNILLITLDTTRADRMGFLGSKRGLTPNLDQLAAQSAVFAHAYSQAPLTSPSHATILSGTYPQFHHVLDFPMPLAKDIPWGPDILHEHGYQTAAFLASMALDPTGGAPGFDRGFDIYDAGFSSLYFGKLDRYHTIERRGSEVVDRALAWQKAHPKTPFFMWVHLYDAHDPYDPPEPFKTRYASALYDGEIAYLDSVVGQLLSTLKARGLYDGTVIALMADHGESLGAHGEETHGIFLYDETINVPLLIKLPNGSSADRKIDNKVELVDVMPTLFDAVGLPVPDGMQGQSLIRLVHPATEDGAASAQAWRDRPPYSQADYANIAYGWSVLQSLRAGKYLYIQAPHRELYDQTADPENKHNLATESSPVADTLAAQTQTFWKSTSSARELPKGGIDPVAQQKLGALGYIVSSAPTQLKPGEAPIDPKDKIETVNKIRAASNLVENQKWAEAIPKLQELADENPQIAILFFKLGGCYMNLNQFDKAIPPLRKSLEIDPTFVMAKVNLSKALIESRNYAAAIPVLEEVTTKIPGNLDLHILLEFAYARSGHYPETIREAHRVLELMPNHFRSHMMLARALIHEGKFEEAVPVLKEAASLEPKLPGPHWALAEAYNKSGHKEEGAKERAEGDLLQPNAIQASEPD